MATPPAVSSASPSTSPARRSRPPSSVGATGAATAKVSANTLTSSPMSAGSTRSSALIGPLSPMSASDIVPKAKYPRAAATKAGRAMPFFSI
ncbi:hypothetical protein V5P93_002408 [Actinokineospora auranticolor]|nr:hypothetical protein [Actinokineospora auranticolor]